MICVKCNLQIKRGERYHRTKRGPHHRQCSVAWSLRTFTGRMINPCDIRTEEVDINDIAHSLAHQCRFLGHARGFYSVAQHSVIVSELVPKADSLWGLLHDAAEAYLGDIIAPIKRCEEMYVYRSAEDRVLKTVAEKFALNPVLPASVEDADKSILATEFRDITTVDDPGWIISECGCEPIAGLHITPWPPDVAEDRFLRRFWELAR